MNLYDDDKLMSIVKLENQLEAELASFTVDQKLVKEDARYHALAFQLKMIEERIVECKTELEQNPFNPNYHRALYTLLKSKRHVIELFRKRENT